MAFVFDKLNLKDQSEILIVNAPASFEPEIDHLNGVSVLRNSTDAKLLHFSLAFVTRQVDLNNLAKKLCPKAEGDAVLWFAYPKGTSKKYKCDFNRDTGWDFVRAAGFDSVRQVSIDEDWSALRFRRVEFIKSTGRKQK